jgi:hypothetical protein
MTNNKQQTAVEWFFEQLTEVDYNCINKTFLQNDNSLAGYRLRGLLEQAKEINKEQSQAYAAFCVACDRKELPLLEFDGWVKLEGNNKL